MLASDVALVGDDTPFSAREALDVANARAAMDRGAKLACACRHRVGHIGRRDMAVMEGPEGRHNAEGLEKRMILPDLAKGR